MAIPLSALTLGEILDPAGKREAVLNFSGALESEEEIASYTITLSAASVAAGMTIPESGARSHSLVNDATAIMIWPLIDVGEAEDVSFDGAGVTLDFKVHYVTTAIVPREDDQTFLIQWAQK